MCAAMAIATALESSPKQKVENLLLTISDHIEEIAGIQRVVCLRPESPAPANPDTVREVLVRLQTKLTKIHSRNKTHLMDPIHDEVRFQVRQIEQTLLEKLRNYVRWLVRTEEEELDKQRWRTRAVLQESTVDLPTTGAARQLQSRPPRGQSPSPFQSQSQPQSRSRSPPRSHSRSRSWSRSGSGGDFIPSHACPHPDPREAPPNHDPYPSRTILYNEETAARRARVPHSTARPSRHGSRLPVPVKPKTELITIALDDDSFTFFSGSASASSASSSSPSSSSSSSPASAVSASLSSSSPACGRSMASVYDPVEFSMPAFPPSDVGFDPARPLRVPSWGDGNRGALEQGLRV